MNSSNQLLGHIKSFVRTPLVVAGMYEFQITTCIKSLEEDINNIKEWKNLGTALSNAACESHDNDSKVVLAEMAIDCIDIAIAADPEDMYPYIDKCDTLITLGRRDDALACVNELAKFDNNSANSVRNSRNL